METSPLFARTFDFLSWLLPRTQSFPRAQRFSVTQRLQNAALDFQELIVEAEAARGGVQHLQAFRDGLLADAIAGDDGDAMLARHGSVLRVRVVEGPQD